jgi:hypothetical protein
MVQVKVSGKINEFERTLELALPVLVYLLGCYEISIRKDSLIVFSRH